MAPLFGGGGVHARMQRFAEIDNGIPRLVIVTLLLLILRPGFVTIVIALVLTMVVKTWIFHGEVLGTEEGTTF